MKIKIKKLKVSKTWTKVTEGHGHPLVWIMTKKSFEW